MPLLVVLSPSNPFASTTLCVASTVIQHATPFFREGSVEACQHRHQGSRAHTYISQEVIASRSPFLDCSNITPTDFLCRASYLGSARQTMPTTTAETLSLVTRNVSVAPLVLLSAVDHYNRTAQKNKKRRVVGVLLGQNDGKNVRVSNSFAGTY